jgi:hypothetical protein
MRERQIQKMMIEAEEIERLKPLLVLLGVESREITERHIDWDCVSRERKSA